MARPLPYFGAFALAYYLGEMALAHWYLGRSDVLFRSVSSQKAEAYLSTTHITSDESHSNHGSADHAGKLRKCGDGSVDEGPTVLMLGIHL